MEEIAIIILHYKTIDKTRECIKSILKMENNYKILIVDNHSSDGTLSQLHEEYDVLQNVFFLEMENNIGFAKANNAAMRLLSSQNIRYAVLTNNDIVFTKDSINRMVNSLTENNQAVIAAPRVRNPKGEIQDTVQLKTNPAYYYLFGPISRNKTALKSEQLTKVTEVELFSGCCFACDLFKMKELGYFDEYTFLYYEEPILSEKILTKGYHILYVPDAEVMHYHGSSTKGISEKKFSFLMDSEAYYLLNYRKINPTVLVAFYHIKSIVHRIKYKSAELYESEQNIIKKIRDGRYEKPQI